MKILAIGDIVGENGLRKLRELLPTIIEKENIDFTVVNAENTSGGMGLNEIDFKNKKKMKINDLFQQICDIKGLSEDDFVNQIGDFFEILTTDKKFTMLENGFWDLKSRHSEKLIVEEDDEFEEDVEETKEEDETEEPSIDDTYYDEDDVDDDTESDLKDLVIIDEEEEDSM